MKTQNTKKYPVDILIEEIDKIFMRDGKSTLTEGNQTGSFIHILPKRKKPSDNTTNNK